MRSEPVEIYSDATNAAVMRHPGRQFPGILVQCDTLWSMCYRADQACLDLRETLQTDAYTELNDLRNHLWALLTHYKAVLTEHGIPPPFDEIPVVRLIQR
jgi:hypothetical protein